MPPRIRLLVVYGGRSAEHDISCISARHVLEAADLDRYDLVPIGITRAGKWVDAAPLLSLMDPTSPSLPSPDTADPTDVMDVPSFASGAAAPSGVEAEAVFPVLHGPGGEDGTVQGMAEVWGLPCVGAGVLASALCMDKWAAKEVVGFCGIDQTPWRGVRSADLSPAWFEQIERELGYPCFVKPANLGSSIGISRVENREGFVAGVELASGYDDRIVVEQAVVGREIEVAVLGNDAPEASVPGEIGTGGATYDFEAKYESDAVSLLIPAPLSEAEVISVQERALQVYAILGVSGMARIDFFLDAEGRFLLNEVNTVPGFTPISMYPALWAASGLPTPRLIDRLVDLAIERHGRRSTRRVDH